LPGSGVQESLPGLAAPSEGENLIADYGSTGFSLGRHPVALLRPALARLRCLSAAQMDALAAGRRLCACGLVTCRQRPDSKSGVVFVTLEDETGWVNVVVWRRLAERQRQALLGARLLGVEGKLERHDGVVHLIASRLIDHSALLGTLRTSSRDFQ
jgi:error-prone DNA polymerase